MVVKSIRTSEMVYKQTASYLFWLRKYVQDLISWNRNCSIRIRNRDTGRFYRESDAGVIAGQRYTVSFIVYFDLHIPDPLRDRSGWCQKIRCCLKQYRHEPPSDDELVDLNESRQTKLCDGTQGYENPRDSKNMAWFSSPVHRYCRLCLINGFDTGFSPRSFQPSSLRPLDLFPLQYLSEVWGCNREGYVDRSPFPHSHIMSFRDAAIPALGR